MTLLQQTFHTIGKLRLGNLPRVSWTHCRNVVCVVQPGLQERNLAVKLQPVHIKERPWQLDVIHMLCIKHALIRQIVHSEHRLRRMTARRQIRRGQPGMPVVRVHHIRAPEWIKTTGHFTSDPAEQCKAQDVIGIGKQICVVIRAAGAVIEMRRINQVNADTVVMSEQQGDSASKGIPARYNLRIRDTTANIGKRREQHAGIHSVRNLRSGQCPNHIRQSPGF